MLLSLAMTAAGLTKLTTPIPELIEMGMLWVNDFQPWQVRAIGGLEFLAVLGLNLPYLIKALPKILVPLAGAGLALTMVGAFITHAVRGDPVPSMVITSVLVVLCTLFAVKRFQGLKAEGSGGQ